MAPPPGYANGMDLFECFNYCFDLGRIFIFYYVEPKLKTVDNYKDKFNSWTLFKENVTILKRKMKTDRLNYDELKHFVQPVQNELDTFGVNVLRLHDFIQYGNTLNHSSIRSTEEQLEHLDYLLQYEFSTKFIHRDLARTMINLLKQTRLRRSVNWSQISTILFALLTIYSRASFFFYSSPRCISISQDKGRLLCNYFQLFRREDLKSIHVHRIVLFLLVRVCTKEKTQTSIRTPLHTSTRASTSRKSLLIHWSSPLSPLSPLEQMKGICADHRS